MKHLVILVPEGQNNLSSIVGTYKIMTRANQYWENLGNRPVFNIELGGLSKEIRFHNALFAAYPTKINRIKRTDLIVIPSLNHNFLVGIEKNKLLIKWIKEQHFKGAEIASICTGAFLLASTGLLDGKECSTHWSASEAFKKMFPEVNLVSEKTITDNHGIYTNGGAFSFLNLILYLVEKYFDRKTAIYCAKVFQIDIERSSQSPFTIFSGLKDHPDEEIKKAQHIIEKSHGEKILVEDLASRFAVGRRNFDRRFKRATGNTPIEYLQKVKVEAAKRSLESSRKNVAEVMQDVGYSDQKAFRELFKKLTGLSPLEYRNKYNKSVKLKG
jgi:transcriptional regulator GlxA family with amidase domain